MSRNVEVPVRNPKQKPRLGLLSQQNLLDARRETRSLNASFVYIVGALPSRPAPRHVWDNVAAPNRLNHPCATAVAAIRSAIAVAATVGSMAVLEETARRSDAYWDACKMASKAPYLAVVGGDVCVQSAMAAAVKEMGEATHAMFMSPNRLTDGAHLDELTDREIYEAMQALNNVLAARAVARAPLNPRPALALS